MGTGATAQVQRGMTRTKQQPIRRSMRNDRECFCAFALQAAAVGVHERFFAAHVAIAQLSPDMSSDRHGVRQPSASFNPSGAQMLMFLAPVTRASLFCMQYSLFVVPFSSPRRRHNIFNKYI